MVSASHNGWTKLRDPRTFPVLYSSVVLAAFHDDKEVILTTCPSPFRAKRFLDKFREWRFHLRNWPGESQVKTIETTRRIKTRVETIDGLSIVYLRVSTDHRCSMLDLNPELAALALED